MKSKLTTITIIAFLSTILWVFISLSDQYFAVVELPIQFANMPGKYAIGKATTQTVRLGVKGQGWQIAKLFFGRSSNFNIQPSYRLGKHSFKLKSAIEKNPWLTSNMQITEIRPEIIKYTVENVVSKKVRIKPVVNLSYRDGYGLVSQIVLSDDTVKVTGAKSIIEKLEFLETKTYDFLNLEDGINAQVEIKELPGIVLSQSLSNIKFDVQKIVDKTYNEIFVKIINCPNQRELVLFPNKITVVIRGGINVLGQLNSEAIDAYIDFNKALVDTSGRLNPIVKIPEGTSLVDIKPSSLGYIIKQY